MIKTNKKTKKESKMWNWSKKVYGSARLKRDTEKDNRWELDARVRMKAENRPKMYGRQARAKMISRLAVYITKQGQIS
jgi:hypothetical protein